MDLEQSPMGMYLRLPEKGMVCVIYITNIKSDNR